MLIKTFFANFTPSPNICFEILDYPRLWTPEGNFTESRWDYPAPIMIP